MWLNNVFKWISCRHLRHRSNVRVRCHCQLLYHSAIAISPGPVVCSSILRAANIGYKKDFPLWFQFVKNELRPSPTSLSDCWHCRNCCQIFNTDRIRCRPTIYLYGSFEEFLGRWPEWRGRYITIKKSHHRRLAIDWLKCTVSAHF